MHTKLTLQEKLKDFKDERKVNLTDIEQATGISVPTLSRFANDEYASIAYQDLMKLAKFYNVSMDYLCGMTNHRNYRNTRIDELGLTDEVVELLKSKRANNRLICELLTQEDFIKLLSTIEIYIDGKISAGSNSLNATIQLVEKSIEKQINLQDKEEILNTLREAFIDENACLRYRITERFHVVLQLLFEQHKQNVSNEAEIMIVDTIEECLDTYAETQKTGKFKYLDVAAKQLHTDISDFTYEEKVVIEKYLSKISVDGNSKLKNRSIKHYQKRKPSK